MLSKSRLQNGLSLLRDDTRFEQAVAARHTFLFLGITGVILALRNFALTADFPINDGALFLEFLNAITITFPSLPVSVRYNWIEIPFAYPPLSFWLGALLTKLGFAPLNVIHYVPIALNILYGLLFATLLLRSRYSKFFTAIALLFFFTALRSFEWLVMGGGFTRGFGSVFFLLVLIAGRVPGPVGARRSCEPLALWRLTLAGALVGCTILSHLEWGILAAATLVLGRALTSRNMKEFLVGILVPGFIAMLVISPWLLFVYRVHGLDPFLAASTSSGWDTPYLDAVLQLGRSSIINPLLPLGALVLILRREFFWPAFLLFCLLLTPRSGGTPLVLAIAVISAHGALTAWQLLKKAIGSPRRAMAAAALVVVASVSVRAVLTWNAIAYGTVRDGEFRALSRESREAMEFVRREHPRASVAILRNAPWYYDGISEWFPTLSGARSLTTVQGREWLPPPEFQRSVSLSMGLRYSDKCADLLRVLEEAGTADLVWAERMQHCFVAPTSEAIYQRGSIAIFKRSADRRKLS